jgi:hypothetical protein
MQPAELKNHSLLLVHFLKNGLQMLSLKIIKNICLLSFAILICFSFFPEKEDAIVWNEDRPLTWEDYKGRPERRFAAASTFYNIVKKTEDNGSSAEVSVKATFYCKNSWKKKSWINESVLRHEQKHFDIVELYSRKLRKMIFEHKYRNYEDVKTKTDSLYDIIDKQMDVYQDKYDEETDGSMNGDKQREWEPKIMKQIKDLEVFKNTELTVSYTKK